MSASVVIVTFNHVRYLPDALESALAQTLPGVEVMVVDDGSTDDTPAVLAKYAGRVRVVRQPNRGPSAARNAGVAASRGEYVAFLGADDVLAPTKLAEQTAVLAREPRAGWTYCDVRIEDTRAGVVTTTSERFGYRARRLDGWLFSELVRGNFIPMLAPLVRRSALAAAGPFDERLRRTEDCDLWLRLSLVAEARYTPRVLATYRMREAGLSGDRAAMDRNRFLMLDGLLRSRPGALAALGMEGRRIVADTHNWFGLEARARGDWTEARRRFAASVRQLPWQRRAPLLLLESLLRRPRA